MAVGRGKTRVQLTLQDGLLEKIDAICEQAKVSRAVWMEYTLAMAADAYDGITEAAARIAMENANNPQ